MPKNTHLTDRFIPRTISRIGTLPSLPSCLRLALKQSKSFSRAKCHPTAYCCSSKSPTLALTGPARASEAWFWCVTSTALDCRPELNDHQADALRHRLRVAQKYYRIREYLVARKELPVSKRAREPSPPLDHDAMLVDGATPACPRIKRKCGRFEAPRSMKDRPFRRLATSMRVRSGPDGIRMVRFSVVTTYVPRD